MYMQVSTVICLYHQYLYVLDHWGTETTTASPKHPLVTPHPGGPTQGTPGQVTNHCLTPSLSPPSTRFFYVFMKNQCLALSCHGHRNGQYPPKGPKLCPIALPQALYRTQSRVLNFLFLWKNAKDDVRPTVFRPIASSGMGFTEKQRHAEDGETTPTRMQR